MAKGNALTKNKKKQAYTHYQNHQLHDARSLYADICRVDPIDAESLNLLGLINEQLGLYDEAECCFSKILTLLPGSAESHYNLGKILELKNNYEGALEAYSMAAKLRPELAAAHTNKGVMLEKLGRKEEALACHREAVRLAPGMVEARFNLGSVFQDLGRYDEADASYREALRLKPDFAEVLNNLGNISYFQGHSDRAMEFYQRAVQTKPDYVEAYSNIGNVLVELGQVEQAVQWHLRAVAINQSSPKALNHLASALRQQGNLEAAEKVAEQSLKLNPSFVEAQLTLGSIHQLQGLTEAACKVLQESLNRAPHNPVVHSNLLMTMHYRPEFAQERLVEEARNWARRHAFVTNHISHDSINPDPDRLLRIGYVSGDFHSHPVGYFVESVISRHDKNNHEIICYHNNNMADDLTRRLQQHSSVWRSIAGHADKAVAEQIRQDSIDILIDLSGHTGKNRLLSFAYKPAPIQATWMGYFATTGLSEMDYIIADRYVIPPDEEKYYTERVARLPESYLCFTPPDIELRPGELPAFRAGGVTFGCFNNTAKLTDEVVACWSRLLHVMPNTRLLLKNKSFGDNGVIRRYQAMFSNHGIGEHRVKYSGYSPRHELLSCYREVDIALDPFPYHGGTTTVEALWMGVPVVSLRGRGFVSHVGESILANVGLGECVVDNEEEYLDKVKSLASDLPLLQDMRKSLRARLSASPLCNAPAFTRNLESLYRAMWRDWCRNR